MYTLISYVVKYFLWCGGIFILEEVMKKVNSTYVAEQLGISQASISRAFNMKSSMTNQTRTQILKRCQAEGYRVEVAERLLKTENPIRVAFLISELHNPFFSSLLNDFSEVMRGYDQYLLEIHIVTDHSEQYLHDLVRNLQRTGVQSIITASHVAETPLPKIAEERGIPLIAINRTIMGSDTSSVASDNYKNGYNVAQYLYEKGHRSFLFLGADTVVPTIDDRLAGVQQFVREYTDSTLVVLKGAVSYEGAYEMIKGYADSLIGQGITAVIGGNDIVAIGAIDSLRCELNLSIPDDISVFGFDDIPMAAWEAYQLSTIRQRTRLMSKEAIEILEIILNDNEGGLERKSQGAFILRNSA